MEKDVAILGELEVTSSTNEHLDGAFRSEIGLEHILQAFGRVDVHQEVETQVRDSFQAPQHDSVQQHSKKHYATTAAPSSGSAPRFLLGCFLLLGAAAMTFRKRTYRPRDLTVDYEPVTQVEFGDTLYVEMASPSAANC